MSQETMSGEMDSVHMAFKHPQRRATHFLPKGSKSAEAVEKIVFYETWVKSLVYKVNCSWKYKTVYFTNKFFYNCLTDTVVIWRISTPQ